MKLLSFILALSTSAAIAQELGVSAPDAGESRLTSGSQQVEQVMYLQPSTATGMLDAQLDQVSRDLEERLEQRLAERAAARITGDRLLVSAD
jgi:hypothetical protein